MRGPAQLYRSRAASEEEVDHASSELIGDGDLPKMVRLALSDPEDELWRYSISFGSRRLVGAQISDAAL